VAIAATQSTVPIAATNVVGSATETPQTSCRNVDTTRRAADTADDDSDGGEHQPGQRGGGNRLS